MITRPPRPLIAAVASALTGRRRPSSDAPEPLGYELAAAAAEGGFEPSELIAPDVAEGSGESTGKPGSPG